MSDFALAPKIMPALRRLRGHYDRKNCHDLRDLINASLVYVEFETAYDNWNGGAHGHDVILFVPEEMMALVDLDEQHQLFERIREDINKATPEVENEYVRAVFVKPVDQGDPQCQAASAFTFEPRARPVDTGLWQGNSLRLFISHRDSHKASVHILADELAPYGISSFVAHDAIKPMREWQHEIHKALVTMEVMLAFLTDDFHDSHWTNQEVGFALGKGIPIICLKVASADPSGFLGSKQALKGDYDQIGKSAPEIQEALMGQVGQEGRFKEIMIEAFISATSYSAAIDGLRRLSETASQLTDAQFMRIAKGYSQNSQLYGCIGIHNRDNWFKRYLESATGKKLKLENRKIVEIKPSDDEKIPF